MQPNKIAVIVRNSRVRTYVSPTIVLQSQIKIELDQHMQNLIAIQKRGNSKRKA